MSEKMPQEIAELMEALVAGREGEVKQNELTLRLHRDMMKMAELVRLMGIKDCAALSPEQRNLIALGWLSGAYHENCSHMARVGGGRQAHMLMAIIGTAHEGPLQVYYDVQEHVVVNYLDTDDFSRKAPGIKAAPLSKSMDTIEKREQRMAKIMRMRNKDVDDDEEGEEITSIAAKANKNNKNRKLN